MIGTAAPTSTGAYTFSLNAAGVALVQKWVNDSTSNHGLILVEPTNTNDMQFRPKYAATVANRPELTVTYTP